MKISEKSHELRPMDLGKNPSELRARRWRVDDRNEGTNVVSEAMMNAMPISRPLTGPKSD